LKYSPKLPLVYLMVLTQGALGYGLTSVMGPVVLEIFQGKHYGGIFGTIHAGGAGGRRRRAVGPPVFCTTFPAVTRSPLRPAIANERAVRIRDLAGVRLAGSRRGRATAQSAGLSRPANSFRQADEISDEIPEAIPIALCRSPMARRKKLSAGVVSGSIRRCRTEAVLQREQYRAGPGRVQRSVLPAILQRGLHDIGD